MGGMHKHSALPWSNISYSQWAVAWSRKKRVGLGGGLLIFFFPSRKAKIPFFNFGLNFPNLCASQTMPLGPPCQTPSVSASLVGHGPCLSLLSPGHQSHPAYVMFSFMISLYLFLSSALSSIHSSAIFTTVYSTDVLFICPFLRFLPGSLSFRSCLMLLTPFVMSSSLISPVASP